MTNLLTRSRRARVLVPSLLVVVLLGSAVITAAPGESATTTAGPVTVTATPTQGLADGQVIAIHLDIGEGEIYEARAHLCRHDAHISNTTSFGFQSGKCPVAAIGAGQFDEAVTPEPGAKSADLNFTVGIGGITWVDELGYPHEMSCGPGAPCDLVVQVQITDDTVYATFPLLLGEGAEPVPPPPPAADPGAPDPAAAAADAGAAASAAPSAPPASNDAQAAKHAAATAANAKHKDAAGSSSSDAAGANGGATAERTLAAQPTVAVTAAGVSRGVRVFFSMLAGLAGGVLIVLIIARARRRMSSLGAT
ncbi:MAG TPA: hypothetical protein VFZ17_05970 [Acidimicrobiia bacterium]|nr:hypothetical protein [Acidimicrobiia bacterium]